jgi:hypothetical protein
MLVLLDIRSKISKFATSAQPLFHNRNRRVITPNGEQIGTNNRNVLVLRKNGVSFIGIRQEMAMNSLKFHLGPPCPTLLRPACRLFLKRPYGRFRVGPPTGLAACGHLLSLWTPHALRLWCLSDVSFFYFLLFVKTLILVPRKAKSFRASLRGLARVSTGNQNDGNCKTEEYRTTSKR